MALCNSAIAEKASPEPTQKAVDAGSSTGFGSHSNSADSTSFVSSLSGKEEYVDEDGWTQVVIGVANLKINSYAALSGLVSKYSGEVTNTISIGQNKAVVVNVPSGEVSDFVGAARTSGLTRYIEPNMNYQITLTPNDPFWSSQWGPQKIKADYAWNTTTGSSSVLVAIVDTGIDYNHPDLAANYNASGHDWVNNDNNPMDDHGHGTHCAGTIAAITNNGIGVAGLAQVKIMAEKAFNATGWGTNEGCAQAITDAVDKGAQIISNSWGSTDDSALIHEAIQYAVAHGVLVVFSAGNDGSSERSYPGAYDEVIAVTATNTSDTLASFSNYGDWVDIAAPGVNIYSTMPTYTVTMNTAYGYPKNYSYMSGTSMACPHVAGLAALIKSQNPNMSADMLRYQIETTADDIGAYGFDVYFGHGRINAQKAVEQTPPNHDVIAYSMQPNMQYPKLGDKLSFNLTAFNQGIQNESNLQFNLLVNGTVVNSTTVVLLKSANYASKTLDWTPTGTGTYNVTFALTPVVGETVTSNNYLSQTFNVVIPPNANNWTLLATDPDEGNGLSLKAGYTQMQSGVAYFKVTFHHNWTNPQEDIDAAIMIDSDNNPKTGLPDGNYPDQNDFIGADCMIIVGQEGPVAWVWNDNLGFFDEDNQVPLAYLDAPDNSSTFIVGVNMADLHLNGAFNFVFCDAYSDFDWMPNTGYVPFIQNAAQHQLAVTLLAPMMLVPNQPANITANVFNFGTSTEANVTLRLLINGQTMNSVTFASIANATSSNMTYTWAPTVQGHYNVTAYALSVSGETDTADNVQSKTVAVSQKIGLISDTNELWYILPLLNKMDVNYDLYEYNVDELYTENVTLLENYSTVIFYNYNRAITASEQTALNAYLASGGNLIVTGYDSLGHPNDTRLANVVRSSTVGDDLDSPNLIVVNATHPIMNGEYGVFPVGFQINNLDSDNDAAQADTARNAQTIAELADGNDKIIATEGLPGKVVYWNGEGVSDWVDNVNCTKMFKNLMLWLVDTSPPVTANNYDGLWHTSNFVVQLTATDYFGVAQTYYKINGGATKTVVADGQPNISIEGASNSLEYWSVDFVGNVETPHKTLSNIKLDTIAPLGAININNGSAYVNVTYVILSLSATDSNSGVAQMRISNDSIAWTSWQAFVFSKTCNLTAGDGTKTIYVQYRDNAGLTSTTYSASIILDTTVPTVNPGQSQTVTQGNTVTFNAGGSGDPSGILSYFWNFGDGTTGTGITTTHTYSTAKTYTVTLTVTDSAGNSATQTLTVTVNAPAATATPTPYTSPTATPTPTPVPSTSPTATASPTVAPTATPQPMDMTMIIIIAIAGAAIVAIAVSLVFIRNRH